MKSLTGAYLKLLSFHALNCLNSCCSFFLFFFFVVLRVDFNGFFLQNLKERDEKKRFPNPITIVYLNFFLYVIRSYYFINHKSLHIKRCQIYYSNNKKNSYLNSFFLCFFRFVLFRSRSYRTHGVIKENKKTREGIVK